MLGLIRNGHADIEIGADTGPALTSAKEARGHISRSEATIYVDADLSRAERELKEFKARLKTLGVRVSGVTSVGRRLQRWVDRWRRSGEVPRRVGARSARRLRQRHVAPLQRRAGAQSAARGQGVRGPFGAVRGVGSAPGVDQRGGMPPSHNVTNDASLRAGVVNILTQDARSFQREMRTKTYRAKGRPGRDGRLPHFPSASARAR